MTDDMMPAPVQGAGDAGRSIAQTRTHEYLSCAREEISNLPLALDHAADAATEFAEIVHELECEANGLDHHSAAQARAYDPLLLMRYLPPQATTAVRREVERKLRLWPGA